MKHDSRKLATLVALASTLGIAAQPALGERYTVTDLGTLPGYANSFVWELTLNNNGGVGVYANNPLNPNAFSGDASFLWHAGKATRLPALPGATDTLVTALNDRFEAVGFSGADGLLVHAVLWKNGKVRDLGTLPGDGYSIAINLNNRDQVVGDSFVADDPKNNFFGGHHAVVWTHGDIRLLPSLPGGGADDIAFAINDNGQIVGQSGPDDGHIHAVLWDEDGQVEDLGTLGGDSSFAIGIGPDGRVVGGAQAADGNERAFVWRKGVMTELGTAGDDVFVEAVSINKQGQSVGISAANLTDLTAARATMWEEGGAVVVLQTEISPDSGWQLLGAASINDRGQIAGYGMHNGLYRAFLLTPKRPDD